MRSTALITLCLLALGGCSTSTETPPPADAAAPAAVVVDAEARSAPAPEPEAVAKAAPAKPVVKTSPVADDGLNRGDPAADFKGEVVYGGKGQLSLAQFVGPAATTPKDAAIVAFGASWCGYCKASLETLKELQAGNPTLQILYVGVDSNEAGWQKEIALFDEKGMNFPLIRPPDPGAVQRTYFGAKENIPRFYLVDHAGIVRVKDQGFTKAKMGSLLPKQVAYLMNLAKRDAATKAAGSSPG